MTNTTLVPLPDGRTLAVEHHGPASGPAVVLLHPAPGSRAFDPDPAATEAAGVRLLTLDRPGYGRSTALPSGRVPTLAGMADDVAIALAFLGVHDAAVVGWSNGGLVGLALAAGHPQLVRVLALLGTPAPDEEVPWVGEEFRPVLRSMRADPRTATGDIAAALAPLAADPAGAASMGSISGGPADDKVLAVPGHRARVAGMLAEAFRQGPVGTASDIVAVNVAPWGFDPASVGAPVVLHYGDDDTAVPPAHGRYWAGVLASAELRVVPAAGHLFPLFAWADILRSLDHSRS